MKYFITFCLALLLCVAPVLGTPIGGGTSSIKLGAFTGPVGGSNQDDNTKASLDLAHTDLDAIIAAGVDVVGLQGLGGTAVILYVDSAETSGTESGLTWATATDTLDEAISLAALVTGKGSIVLVAAGHVETITAANAVDVDKANVIIIGLGTGEGRPTFTYTTNGEFVIGADNVEVHNINFIAGNAVTHAIDVEAGFENFVINNCRFAVTVADTDEFVDCIDIAAGSDNGKITNCRFEMTASSAVSAISHIGSDYTEISDNVFSGDFSTACIEDATTASIWMLISNNRLVQGTVGGTAGLNAVACISLKSDTTAIITDNHLFSAVATQTLAIVAADGFLTDNTLNQAEGSFLEVGKIYTLSKVAVVTGATDALFLVAGGPIEVISMFGNVTTIIASTPGNVSINLNSADDDFDSDLSIVVALADGSLGDTVVFGALTASENAGVLTANQSASIPLSWFISVGTIEQTLSGTGTGNVTWYMTFRPLVEGVTVVVQ